jgi:hypothetical protein
VRLHVLVVLSLLVLAMVGRVPDSEGGWLNLLSLKTAEVLAHELVGRIVTVAKAALTGV